MNQIKGTRRLSGRLLLLAIVLAGCSSASRLGEQIFYAPPRGVTQPDAPIVLHVGGVSAATAGVYRRLVAAGHVDRRARRSAGVITGRSTINDLVDCGVITQTALGETSSFPANSARAVIFGSDPLDLSLREVIVATNYRVTVTGGPLKGQATAELAQTHQVIIRRSRLDDDEPLFKESRQFTPGGRARFGDGTVCVSSGRLLADLR